MSRGRRRRRRVCRGPTTAGTGAAATAESMVWQRYDVVVFAERVGGSAEAEGRLLRQWRVVVERIGAHFHRSIVLLGGNETALRLSPKASGAAVLISSAVVVVPSVPSCRHFLFLHSSPLPFARKIHDEKGDRSLCSRTVRLDSSPGRLSSMCDTLSHMCVTLSHICVTYCHTCALHV